MASIEVQADDLMKQDGRLHTLVNVAVGLKARPWSLTPHTIYSYVYTSAGRHAWLSEQGWKQQFPPPYCIGMSILQAKGNSHTGPPDLQTPKPRLKTA